MKCWFKNILQYHIFLINYYQILNHEGTAKAESKEAIYVPDERWHVT